MYSALICFFWNNSHFSVNQKYFALFHIGVVTILLPILFFTVLKLIGKVDSIMVGNLSQRKIPLLILCVLTLLLIKTSIREEDFTGLYYFYLGGLISTFLALLLIFFGIKASLHMLGICALTLFVISQSIYYQNNDLFLISFLILNIGLVASSRLEMNAHSPQELIIGSFIGIIPQTLLLTF